MRERVRAQGGTTINTGATLQLGNSSSTFAFGSGNIVDNGNLVLFPGSSGLTLANSVSGGGGLTISGGGTATLSGSNSYSGGTTITSGTLVAQSPLPNGTAVTLGGPGSQLTLSAAQTIGVLSGNGAIATNSPLTVASGNFAGNISGTGSLAVSGGGTLILTGTNPYSGGTTIGSGSTLQLSANGAVPANSNIIDNGTLTLISGTWPNFANPISGSGGLTISGGANVTLLATNNSYCGGTTINGATLQTTAQSPLPNGTVVTLGSTSGSQLVLNANQTIGGLSGGGTVVINASSLAVNVSGGSSYAFSGVIGGGGAVTIGAFSYSGGSGGTETFSGANTYTGGTTVNAVYLDSRQ